jgi:hypothetical protein
MTGRDPLALAEIWVASYGDSAPERIRQWAINRDGSLETQLFLRRVAQIADNLIALRR